MTSEPTSASSRRRPPGQRTLTCPTVPFAAALVFAALLPLVFAALLPLVFAALLPLVFVAPPAAVASSTDSVGIVPRPLRQTRLPGRFIVTPETLIVADQGAMEEASKLAALLLPATGFDLAVLPARDVRRWNRSRTQSRSRRAGSLSTAPSAPSIRLRIRPHLRSLGPEGYRLTVRPDQVTISAATPTGLYYGIQSLRQLLPAAVFESTLLAPAEWAIPALRIIDRPRFRWRGAMLDVSRHFFPKDFVKKFLDLLAMHKLNRFHWHLSDDQGWRIEVRRYPKLTEIGAWRAESPVRLLSTGGFLNFLVSGTGEGDLDGVTHGGFYTQDDIREIVAYAAARHITIVPEIDMPGHIQAAIAAYPELGNLGTHVPVATSYGIKPHILNVEEETFAFLENVLTEVMDLFPGEFLHLGGDEVLTNQWQESAAVQEKIAALGLADEEDLRSYFIARMADFLAGHNRRMIGWNEILSGDLPRGVGVMSWIGQAPGEAAARAGHDVVMAPLFNTYFDHAPSLPQTAEERAILAAAADLDSGAVRAFITDLEEAYGFDPVPANLTGDAVQHILGGQAQLWSEWLLEPGDVEYNGFPRLSALAEAVWTALPRKDFADFENRLPLHLKRLDGMEVNYFRSPIDDRTRTLPLAAIEAM